MAKQLTATNSGPRTVTPEFAQKENRYGEPWIPATPQFVYTYHPARWTVIDGRVVPQLGQQVLVDGVNGVEITAGGRVRFSRCRAQIEDRGWQMVPYEWGPGGESYLAAVDTRPNGEGDVQTAYIPVWASAYAGDDRVYPDEATYADWLVSLIEDGKLPSPKPHQLRRMLETSKKKLATASSKGMDVRSEALKAEVEAIEKALEGMEKPKGRKATTRKATTNLDD